MDGVEARTHARAPELKDNEGNSRREERGEERDGGWGTGILECQERERQMGADGMSLI